MQYKKIILLIEDEPSLLDLLNTLLYHSSYKVISARNGTDALQLRQSHNPDLILLDLEIADIDGIAVLNEICCQCETPVIVISSSPKEHDIVKALDCGAHDYMIKPFGNDELLARIRKALRLYERRITGLLKHQENYCFAGLCIDYNAYQIMVNNQQIHLTPIEYKIVELLSKCSGKVLTHEQIINHVWGPDNCDSQVLRVNMANIRRKIEQDPANPQIIVTELGIGYRMGSQALGRV